MIRSIVVLGLLLVGCSGPADPQTGTEEQGAKKCVQNALCIQGDVWSQKSCKCVPDRHVACGTKSCSPGEYCCNASCGICVPDGYACVQIACAQ